MRESRALLLPCPVLNCPGVSFDEYWCEGSLCPRWERSRTDRLVGTCYYLERVEKRKREREEQCSQQLHS